MKKNEDVLSNKNLFFQFFCCSQLAGKANSYKQINRTKV